MLDLFADYDYTEREEIAALEAAEIECERAEITYRSYAKLADLKIKEAALQAAMENADLETLCGYYDEAADGTDEKKQGLLSKAWEALKNLLKKIKETLFGKEVKGGTVSKEQYNFMQALKTHGNDLLAKIKANPFKSAAAIAGVVMVLFKIVKSVRGSKDTNASHDPGVKVNEAQAKGFKKTWDSIVAAGHSLFQKVKPAESEANQGDSKNTNLFRTYFQSFLSGGKGIIAKLRGGKSDDGESGDEDEKKEDNSEDQGEGSNNNGEGENTESYDDTDDLLGEYFGESAEEEAPALDPGVASLIDEILDM